uniref:Uncharacterized protein n=1 Tax=Physcomitrium patens TaxID=3218 RepID=A0A7I4F329_PHYPA
MAVPLNSSYHPPALLCWCNVQCFVVEVGLPSWQGAVPGLLNGARECERPVAKRVVFWSPVAGRSNRAMGWLWACLGGGPEFQPKLCSDKSSRSSKSHRARITNQPHNLRLHPLPAQLPRHGYGDYEHPHLQVASRTGRCGDPENMEQFKIPITSVNTCISINTLKKASERSLESSFRKEFGIARRSDVDELKEELAELRRRLAIEEAEAKKLREEVSHLRSCGVLQKSEGAPDERTDQKVHGKDSRYALDYADEDEKPYPSDLAPTKQLRKCFSGPMLFDVQSNISKDGLESGAMVLHSSQARISSHRVGLSPKPLPFSQGSQNIQSEVTHQINRQAEEEVSGARSISKSSKVSLASNLQQYPSRKVTAWTSLDASADQDHCEGKARDLVILDSMDMHWIEVANAPCSSGFSTNVKGDVNDPRDCAESPRRSLRAASTGMENSIRNSQKSGGKRRQKSRSGLDFQPFEKRSKDLTLALRNQPPAPTSDQVEVQLAQALAAFKEQRRELEAKHQSFSRGSMSSSMATSKGAVPSNAGPMVGFFRSTRRKPHALRNRGFHHRSLSPVEEAQSIEEIAWSRQSTSSKKESESASKPDDSAGAEVIGSSRFCNSVDKSNRDLQRRLTIEDIPVAEPSSVPPHATEQSNTLDDRPVAIAEHIAMVPIQCASPSLSPRKRPASAALDALVTVTGTAKTGAEGRYNVEDSADGLQPEADWIHRACDWDEEDDDGTEHIKPVECASPSFSPRRRTSRGPVSQSIILDPKDSSPRVPSSTEFLEASFLKANSPSVTFKSPSQERLVKTPSPLKQYSPSPLKQCSPSPLKQCSSSTMNECTPSPQKHNNERSWYCDAIEAIQSINDIRSFKERRLLTESVSLGSSPVSKEKTQRQADCPRPPHAFSAEKKALRRAFSWFASEHDERVKTIGTLERPPQIGSVGTEKGNDIGGTTSRLPHDVRNRDTLQRVETCGRQQTDPGIKRGGVLHIRRFSDSDSGGSGSATFSIDLTQGDSSSQNEGECGAGDVRGSINTGASFLRERVDKENVAARVGLVPSKNSILRTSDQSLSSSDSTNKYPRCSQDNATICESRPILGSVPFNHWDKTPTGPRTEESRVEWQAAAKPSYRYY